MALSAPCPSRSAPRSANIAACRCIRLSLSPNSSSSGEGKPRYSTSTASLLVMSANPRRLQEKRTRRQVALSVPSLSYITPRCRKGYGGDAGSSSSNLAHFIFYSTGHFDPTRDRKQQRGPGDLRYDKYTHPQALEAIGAVERSAAQFHVVQIAMIAFQGGV